MKLEEEIDYIRDKVDRIRRQCTDLEIKVERLRTDIAIDEIEEDRISVKINEYIDRLNI